LLATDSTLLPASILVPLGSKIGIASVSKMGLFRYSILVVTEQTKKCTRFIGPETKEIIKTTSRVSDIAEYNLLT